MRASLTRVGVAEDDAEEVAEESVMLYKATPFRGDAGQGKLGRMKACMNASEASAAGARMSSPIASPELDEAIEVEVTTSENLPWMCIVWDDPVNLMSYVAYVFQTVLGYDRKRANELMMQVHTEGKAVVSSGEKDKVEGDVKKLHTAGLWATMQQAG